MSISGGRALAKLFGCKCEKLSARLVDLQTLRSVQIKKIEAARPLCHRMRHAVAPGLKGRGVRARHMQAVHHHVACAHAVNGCGQLRGNFPARSEEHTSELPLIVYDDRNSWTEGARRTSASQAGGPSPRSVGACRQWLRAIARELSC